MALSRAQRDRIFGAPGKVDKVTVLTPWGIKTVCHRLVAALFLQACREAYETSSWRPQRIDSYNPRPIRGSSKPSMHGYALAWDFFATGPNVPPPGGVWTPNNGVPPTFAHCFTRRGFTWGAVWDRRDVPHIEWAGGVPTGIIPGPSVPTEEVEDLPLGLNQLDDRVGTVDLVCFTLLGNTLPDEDRNYWVKVLAEKGYEALVNGIADTPEARARRTAMKEAGIPGR